MLDFVDVKRKMVDFGLQEDTKWWHGPLLVLCILACGFQF